MRVTDPAEESFTAHQFPCTTQGFLAEHGEVELELSGRTVTLDEVFDCMPDEDLQTEEDARLAVYSALGDAAIGRKGYSDRDPTCPGEDGHEPVSL
jgi:hypothetical protein